MRRVTDGLIITQNMQISRPQAPRRDLATRQHVPMVSHLSTILSIQVGIQRNMWESAGFCRSMSTITILSHLAYTNQNFTFSDKKNHEILPSNDSKKFSNRYFCLI
jgi:hypothetical protein